jgi:putative Holliday junction resolvase
MQYSKCMAFDYGLASSGVAVGYIATQTVCGVGALKMIKGEPNWGELDKLIQQWQPDCLLVGKPLTMNGGQQLVSTRAKQFCDHLKKRYDKDVYEVDERFSTVEARGDIFASHGSKGLKKSFIDEQSAVIICKQWIRAQCFT